MARGGKKAVSGKKIKNMPGYHLGVARDGDKAWMASNRPQDTLAKMKREHFFESDIPPGTMIGLDEKNNGMFLGFLKDSAVALNFKNNLISTSDFKDKESISVMKESYSKKIKEMVKNAGSKANKLLDRKIPGTDISVRDFLSNAKERFGAFSEEVRDRRGELEVSTGKAYKIGYYIGSARFGDLISMLRKKDDDSDEDEIFLHDRADKGDFGIDDLQKEFKDDSLNVIKNGDSLVAAPKKDDKNKPEQNEDDNDISEEMKVLWRVLMAGQKHIVVTQEKTDEQKNSQDSSKPKTRVITVKNEKKETEPQPNQNSKLNNEKQDLNEPPDNSHLDIRGKFSDVFEALNTKNAFDLGRDLVDPRESAVGIIGHKLNSEGKRVPVLDERKGQELGRGLSFRDEEEFSKTYNPELSIKDGDWYNGKWVWFESDDPRAKKPNKYLVEGKAKEFELGRKEDQKWGLDEQGFYKTIYGSDWWKFFDADRREASRERDYAGWEDYIDYDQKNKRRRVDVNNRPAKSGDFKKRIEERHFEHFINRVKREDPNLSDDKALFMYNLIVKKNNSSPLYR